jgi:hypothetical protein
VRGLVCEGARCLAGQTCGESGCEFPCEGIRVPGDYATLEDVMDAVGTEEVTVCLASGDYGEQRVAGRMTVIGASPDAVQFDTLQVGGSVTVRGFSANRVSVPSGASARLEACRVAQGESYVVSSSVGASSIVLTFSGCEIGGPEFSGMSIHVPSEAYTGGGLTFENCWIHGATSAALGVASGAELASLVVRHSTLTDNRYGIVATRGLEDINLRISNTVIVGSEVALRFTEIEPDEYANIALFDNATNYDGEAAPPPGLVSGDPRFERCDIGAVQAP